MGIVRRIWNALVGRGYVEHAQPRRAGTQRVSDEDIEAAKRVNIAAYIESLGYKPTWTSKSDKVMFLSPLRKEKKPSFSVSLHKGRWGWKDWGSSESGDTISFVEKYHGVGFLDAVRILNNGVSYGPSRPPPPPQESNGHDTDKVEWVRKIYTERTRIQTEKERQAIKRYFNGLGVRYYPEMGALFYTSFKEKKKYLAIPIPLPRSIKGLECREINGSCRKTFGHKTLWVLRRDTDRLLIAESILDALASEIILNDTNLTLCSLNGVGNADKIGDVVKWLRASEVLFALDNDEPGKLAQEKGLEIVKSFNCNVRICDAHIKAGVKDMHKLIARSQPGMVVSGS